MNTHEVYVSLEVAKLLKEAGFNWELNSRWQDWGGKNSHEFILKTDLFYTDRPAEYDGFHALPAPTLDVAQRWLREVMKTEVFVEPFVGFYKYVVEKLNEDGVYSDGRGKTYEEAQEAGIKKALEIILKKGE